MVYSASFSYTAMGELETAQDQNDFAGGTPVDSSYVYQYDDEQQEESVTETLGTLPDKSFGFTYQHDLLGNRTNTAVEMDDDAPGDSSDEQVYSNSYEYDGLNRITQIQQQDGTDPDFFVQNKTVHYDYNNSGQLKDTLYSQSLSTSSPLFEAEYQYNPDGRLRWTGYATPGNGAILDQETVGYNSFGEVVSQTSARKR